MVPHSSKLKDVIVQNTMEPYIINEENGIVYEH